MLQKSILFWLMLFLRTALPAQNIILIVADDLGYGDLGCYGQKKIHTPNIDALARSGMQFSSFYAGTTVCAPSRASLLTGMHTGHTSVRGNRGFEPEGQFPLPVKTLTIAKLLHDHGYYTGDYGKWGLGYPGSTGMPTEQGFDRFFGYNCQSLAHNYYPDHLWLNESRVELKDNLHGDRIYSADMIQEKAIEFLSERSGPYFLFLSYTLPHAALSVPHDPVYDAYVRAFGEKPLDKDKVKPYEKAAFEPYPHAAYAAMVSRLDKYVGEVVKAAGPNTLIIFTSDNGPHREGGNDPEFFKSNGMYRGIKRDLYEGGIRVPFIASWKGHIRPATRNDGAYAFWDLYPTFAEIAGAKMSGERDGFSIVAALEGKQGQASHTFLYWEFHENEGRQAVRMGNWKGVRLHVSTIVDAPVELYDLSVDPGEKHDVGAEHPDVVKRIAGIMEREHQPDPNWPLLVGEIKKK